MMDSPPSHGKSGMHGLLLGRGGHESGGGPLSGFGCGSPLLRHAARTRRCSPDQGLHADPLRKR